MGFFHTIFLFDGFRSVRASLFGNTLRGRVFRACGRGGRMWASAPTHGYRWSFRRGRCPHRPVCRGISLPPSRPLAVTPPSQREARGVPRLWARGTDSHASDVGHWLGMTGREQGVGTVDGCRGGRPHAAEVCAYITGLRSLALPLGELSPQVTERAGMVMVCPLRPRCARPPLPEGEARDAHTAHQNVCRGGVLPRPFSQSLRHGQRP